MKRNGLDKQTTVCYLYRKPQHSYFSIEKIFRRVAGILKGKIEVKEFNVPGERFRPVHILRNCRAARKVTADLYHVTGDVHYLVLGLPGKRTILTIHDCVFIHNTKGIKRWVLTLFLLKWPIRHSKLITTISEKSKQEIIKYSGCSSDKIVVVPNPVADEFYYKPQTFNAAIPVLLLIGTAPNKNLERIIEAVKGLSCRLIIVGRINELQKQKLEQANISYTLRSGLSEEQLVATYSDCDIVLFPSTYEGFGLPVIEGQKAGRPVITSNISPMKEVAGEGACLVDPMNVESIKAGIERVILDTSYRETIVRKGFDNVKQYEAVAIAGQYLCLYEKIITDHKCVLPGLFNSILIA